jgi:acyl-CoA synthetase (AMP-forming)/AMP-acid ligase II
MDTAPLDPALADNLIHRVNVGDSLTRTAARFPDRPAVVDGDRRMSYTELNDWVNRIAHGLRDLGFARGDALALASGNSVEFLVTYYACAKLGVVCVPVNLGWRATEVAYVLEHSEARGIVVEQQLAEAMEPAVGEVPAVVDVVVAPGTGAASSASFAGRQVRTFEQLAASDSSEPEVRVGDRDPITYLYTSGTTSAPKGVVGNHTAIYLESMAMALEARFDEQDRFVAMMPMFHTAQLNCHCTSAIMVGACLHIERAFDPARLLATIEDEQITQIFGLPMMYRAMLDHADIAKRDLTSLRRALYAMAPMPEAQLRQCLEAFGCDFYLLFGQTEMSPTATLFRPEHQLSHNGAAGTPVANVQVAIMDPDGQVLPQGGEGEIVYRGPHTMTEYLKNPEATSTAFAHGWFHSGDVGTIDEDGLLWFRDRTKDVIKTGGENVASIEVEKAIYAASPDVAEVVVVGLPHERWTEAITAVVVPRPGATIDVEKLIADVKAAIDPYKAPKSVIVIDDLPRTSTGKIQKNVVRQEHQGHYSRADE